MPNQAYKQSLLQVFVVDLKNNEETKYNSSQSLPESDVKINKLNASEHLLRRNIWLWFWVGLELNGPVNIIKVMLSFS